MERVADWNTVCCFVGSKVCCPRIEAMMSWSDCYSIGEPLYTLGGVIVHTRGPWLVIVHTRGHGESLYTLGGMVSHCTH